MGLKQYLWAMPVILYPYLMVLLLISIFGNFLHLILLPMNLDPDVFTIVGIALVFWAVGLVSAVTLCAVSLWKKWDAIGLARLGLIVKLAQIPGYIALFVIPALCTITIFTIWFTFAIFLLDCLSINLSFVWMWSARLSSSTTPGG